jgi:hypothetical protein
VKSLVVHHLLIDVIPKKTKQSFMISLSGHFGSAKDNRGVSIKMQVKAVYEIISENINRILVDDQIILRYNNSRY